MKVYTKTGDNGTTSLFGGNRVSKMNPRVDAYGDIDELNSFLGLLISNISTEDICVYLQKIQHILFNLGSVIATVDDKYIAKLPPLKLEYVTSLESQIDQMEAELPSMTNFILPGGDQQTALAHVCRTVCRRTERSLVRLSEIEGNSESILLALKLLNRLSDYFFVLSRRLTQLNNRNEVIWEKEVSL